VHDASAESHVPPDEDRRNPTRDEPDEEESDELVHSGPSILIRADGGK
jgi:hypothetical protein